MMMASKSQLTPQYPFVQTSLLGGAPNADSEPSNNPNQWVTVEGRRARIIPLAGAATYPVLVETVAGTRRWVFDSSAFDIDSGQLRIVPQTMARAFGQGAVQDSGGLNDSQISNALYPKPTSVPANAFVAGSITNSAGFVGGLFAVESGESLDGAPGLSPPFTWCALYAMKMATAAPSGSTPIPLPEFIRRGTTATGAGGIGAIACAFLGCGAGVVRHQFGFSGSQWVNAHVLSKWYLDPFSRVWVPGGSLNIGPGDATSGSICEIEESINLQLPTWLYLQLDAKEAASDVTWTATITRGGR